jgi:hypothetical protein
MGRKLLTLLEWGVDGKEAFFTKPKDRFRATA